MAVVLPLFIWRVPAGHPLVTVMETYGQQNGLYSLTYCNAHHKSQHDVLKIYESNLSKQLNGCGDRGVSHPQEVSRSLATRWFQHLAKETCFMLGEVALKV